MQRLQVTPALLLASLLALLLAPGCEKKKEAEADETAEESAESEDEAEESESDEGDEAEEEASTPSSGPSVTLLEAGEEPRSELRYTLAEGAEEKVALDMSITMQTRAPGLPSTPITLPGMRMVMDLAIQEKLSETEARYGFEVTEAKLINTEGVDPRVVKATEPELGKAVGMSGTAIVDVRGFNRDAELKLPDGLSQQMRQMMQGTKQSLDQLSSPLPEEPVGLGAKWEVHQKVQINGLKVEQTTIYKLTKLDADKGTGVLEATLKQTAPPQKAQTPGMPPGVTAEVLSFESEGSGEVHFDLGALVPKSAKIDVETRNSFKVSQGGREQTMSMKASMGMRIEHL